MSTQPIIQSASSYEQYQNPHKPVVIFLPSKITLKSHSLQFSSKKIFEFKNICREELLSRGAQQPLLCFLKQSSGCFKKNKEAVESAATSLIEIIISYETYRYLRYIGYVFLCRSRANPTVVTSFITTGTFVRAPARMIRTHMGPVYTVSYLPCI